MTSQILAVEPDRHWPSIEQFNLHICPKNSPLHLETISSQCHIEALHQRFSHCRRRGICKAGATSPTHISVEGELRDDQNFAANIEQRAVHLAFIVAKDTQVDYLISQSLYLKLAILLPDSEQNQESLTYLADDFSVYGHAGTAYSL